MTIDTKEFRDLLPSLGVWYENARLPQLIAHIDAQLAASRAAVLENAIIEIGMLANHESSLERVTALTDAVGAVRALATQAAPTPAPTEETPFRKHLRSASEQVAGWPAWKKGLWNTQAAPPVSEQKKPRRPQGWDAPDCTCPSGDGSLRWPCPAHPTKNTKG